MARLKSMCVVALLASLLATACPAGDGPRSLPSSERVFEVKLTDGTLIDVSRSEATLPRGPTENPNLIGPVHSYRLAFTAVSRGGENKRELGAVYEHDFGPNNPADVDWRVVIAGVALVAPDTAVVVYSSSGLLSIDVLGVNAKGGRQNLIQPTSIVELLGTQWTNQPAAAVIRGSFEKGGNVSVKIERNGGGVLRLWITRAGDKCEWSRVEPATRPADHPPSRATSGPTSRPG
jgi:hypothetical protein